MKMSFLRICLTIIFSAFVMYGIGYTAAEISGPHLVVPETNFDFKEVKEGEKIEHTFTIVNKGDEVLEIDRVKPT